jgi:hypothetical protein
LPKAAGGQPRRGLGCSLPDLRANSRWRPRSCENAYRTSLSAKSTRQNGPGSTIAFSVRVEGPQKLLIASVFTQARPEADRHERQLRGAWLD